MPNERGLSQGKPSRISQLAHSPQAFLFLPTETSLIGLNPGEQRPTAFKLGLDTSAGSSNVADLACPRFNQSCRTTGRVAFVLPCSAFYELCRARAPPQVSDCLT